MARGRGINEFEATEDERRGHCSSEKKRKKTFAKTKQTIVENGNFLKFELMTVFF